MLYPSQTRAQDSLKDALSGSNPVVVQGLSGSGKSLIVQQALSEGHDGMVVEDRELSDITNIRRAMSRQSRLIILAQPDFDVSEISKILQTSPALVKVRCLSVEEVTGWLNSIEPALTSEERELVLRYSLGVPLLIERLCAQRPVTRTAALPQCVVYLQSLIEACYIAGEDRNKRLREVLADYTTFDVSDDVLPRLADCDVIRDKNTPLSILHSCLCQGAELPTPMSLEIFELYDEWLQRRPDEPSFDLFIRDMQDAERELHEIGYCRHPDRQALLGRFVHADARKGATFFADRGGPFMRQMDNCGETDDSHFNAALLRLARASGVSANLRIKKIFGRDVVEVELRDTPTPLYIHKHDHTPRDVMPVAYTIECYLQRAGLEYTVQYDEAMFRYDPALKQYLPLEAAKVDYYEEVYGAFNDERQ